MADVRPVDRQECITATGIPLGVALREAVRRGRMVELIALPDGTPLVLWGVGPIRGAQEAGLVWLVATVTAERHVLALHRLLKDRLRSGLGTSQLLWNVVWERNELHVRWLRRLGAEFIAYHPEYGPLGEPFLEFIITKETLSPMAGGAA